MAAWALQIHPDDLEPLAALWRVAGVEAMRQENFVWLRGADPDDATRRLLPTIANIGRFEILEGGALLTSGARVPLGHLPAGPWTPLRKFLTITLPSANIPSRTSSVVEIDLVPSSNVEAANVLVTSFTDWYFYGRQAPQARLKACQFAVCGDGRTFIHGTPLPPLPGTRAVAHSGLVVPCGWIWSPAVDAETLARSWRIRRGDFWLLWPGKLIECVRLEQLVATNRSALQLTWEAFQHVRAS